MEPPYRIIYRVLPEQIDIVAVLQAPDSFRLRYKSLNIHDLHPIIRDGNARIGIGLS